MRRFQFPLKTVLSLRERAEEEAKRHYAQQLTLLHDLQTQKSDVEHQRTLIRQQLLQHAIEGTPAQNLQSFHRYHWQLGIDVLRIDQQINQAEVDLESRRLALVEASRQRKIVETLKQRQFEEWQHEIQHEEQLELDEIATTRFIREKSTSNPQAGGTSLVFVTGLLIVALALAGAYYSGVVPDDIISLPFQRYYENQILQAKAQAYQREQWLLSTIEDVKPPSDPLVMLMDATSEAELSLRAVDSARQQLHAEMIRIERERRMLQEERRHIERLLRMDAELRQQIEDGTAEMAALEQVISASLTAMQTEKIERFLRVMRATKPRTMAMMLIDVAKGGQEDLSVVVEVLYRGDPRTIGPILDAMARVDEDDRQLVAELIRRQLATRRTMPQFN